jgi:hypothetical protein
MRGWHLVLLTAIAMTLVGCRAGTTPPTTVPAKLEDAIVGKWEGVEGDYKIIYDFNQDGTYTYESGNVKDTGKWQAVDDKNVQLTYTLTKEQAEAAKPIWQAAVDILDKIPEFPGAPKVSKPPEPKEGENKVTYSASVSDGALTLGHFRYTKAK